jgi:glycosyltransferase involved in cell wall biosynthesis
LYASQVASEAGGIGRALSHENSLRVEFGPDAFILYPGGVRRVALELVDALRADGIDVVVPEAAERWCRSARGAATLSQRTLMQIRNTNVVDRLRGRRESLVSHSLYYDALQVTRGCPKVVTVYDMVHERFGGGRALRSLKKRAIARADCLIAISAATAHDVARLYPSAPPCVVVPLGLPSTILEQPPDPLDVGRPYLLYVGPRSGYKNFSLLVNALPLLRKHDLALVLAGGENLTDPERRTLALALGDGAALMHLRPTDRELARLYDGASALVITSRCEGFGLPLIEAMARGCAVASSTGGSLLEVSGGMAEMFDPDSASACADAVDRALRTDERTLAEATAYARRYTWQATARRHRELYSELLGN